MIYYSIILAVKHFLIHVFVQQLIFDVAGALATVDL